MVHRLDLAIGDRQQIDLRAGVPDGLAGLLELDLLDAIGGEDRDLPGLQLGGRHQISATRDRMEHAWPRRGGGTSQDLPTDGVAPAAVGSSSAATVASRSLNSAPPPGASATLIVPPCVSTT